MEKELLLRAWKSFRSRPLVWLLVSAACVPYTFAVSTGAPDVVFILGFLLTYMLLFLAWCMAAYTYGGEPEVGTREMLAEARAVLAYQPLKFLNLSAIFGLGVFAASYSVIPMLLNMLVLATSATASTAIGIIFYFLVYILLALALTFYALVPQLATLRHDFEEETPNPSGVLRMSQQLIKGRYKRALPLVLVPMMVECGALLLFGILLPLAVDLGIMFALIRILAIVVLSFIEGAKTAYIAAAFNHFLDQVEVEEREIKKKNPAKDAKAPQPKKTEPKKVEKKQLPSSGKKDASGGKAQVPSRKPGPSPHKKKK